MVFRDDLELPGHRWFAQLPKLAPGRRFELAPPTDILTNDVAESQNHALCSVPLGKSEGPLSQSVTKMHSQQ